MHDDHTPTAHGAGPPPASRLLSPSSALVMAVTSPWRRSPTRSPGATIMAVRLRKPGPRTGCSGSSLPGHGAPIAPAWSVIHFPIRSVVQHARESFVPFKLRSDVHEQLALSFNLSAVPATIIVAPSREVVAIHQGYLGPAEFDAFLRDSLSRLPGTAIPAERRIDPTLPARGRAEE